MKNYLMILLCSIYLHADGENILIYNLENEKTDYIYHDEYGNELDSNKKKKNSSSCVSNLDSRLSGNGGNEADKNYDIKKEDAQLNTVKNDYIQIKNFNTIDIKNMYYKDNKDTTESLTGFTFDTYNDFYIPYDSISFHTNLNYSHLNKPVFNSTKMDTVEIDNKVTITEARIKYNYNKNWLGTIGILPLYRGMTYKYDNFDFTRNDGSYYVSGLILQGAEVIYKDCDNKFYITAGHGYYEKWKINDIELHNKKIRGSDGSYLFFKNKQFYEDYKIEHNFELSSLNYKYDGILGYKQKILGYNFSVQDETHLFWGFAGYQKGEGDNTQIVRRELNIPSYIPDSFIEQNNDTTFIGKYEIEGYSSALGYRYSFDFNHKENFILLENFRTYKNWVSPSYGEPFSEYGLGRLGNQYKIVYGYYIDPTMLIRTTYHNLEYDKIYKIGGSMVQTDISNFPNIRNKEETLIFTLSILF